MGRYLVLWEIDQTRIPIDRTERGAGWEALMTMVKTDQEKKLMSSWGAFVGETSGYTIYEGEETEVMIALQQYVPFARFKVHPLASIRQVDEMIKSLSV